MKIAYAFPEERWDSYVSKMHRFFRLRNTNNEQDQLNFLLFTAGDPIAASAIEEPLTNTTRNIYNFCALAQYADETFDSFYAKLQKKLPFCAFPKAYQEYELKHTIKGCASKQLRPFALSNPEQTVAKLPQK